MFCDQTILKLKGGDGGKGSVSFRREKFVPKGGPDGGDGGNGGNIYFKVNNALNSLIHLDTYKHFQAENGVMGKGKKMHGRTGEDLHLEVPLGTIVREIVRDKKGNIKKKETADMSRKDKILLVSHGGRGGYGNAHFVSSVRQAPKFAELGEEGEEIEVELELKLVADIGIIGIPSAGKSSLISVISNAKPKIAAYPFTTLIPHLGVVQIAEKETYVVADIPGLIEGAHRGKGLGIKFLKHVQRCRLLVHLIDPSQGNSTENFKLINHELTAFSKNLSGKKQIIVINKADVMNTEEEKELLKTFKKEITRKKRFVLYPHAISAATTKGVKELKTFLYQELQKIPKPEWLVGDSEALDHGPSLPGRQAGTIDHILYRPHLDHPKYFSVEKIKAGKFRVTGHRIEQILNMSDFRSEEAVLRVQHVLKKMGIERELKKLGIKDGDTVEIGKRELEYQREI